MKNQNQSGLTDQSGKTDKGIVLLEYLKERSGQRFSKLEAFLDILDKAKEQYVPKDLRKQAHALSENRFITTTTTLALRWNWHRATVRKFLEQLEAMGHIDVTPLSKSKLIHVPRLDNPVAALPFDEALADFRQRLQTELSGWSNGTMSVSGCASVCEHLLDEAVGGFAKSRDEETSGNETGEQTPDVSQQEHRKQAFRRVVISCVCGATFRRILRETGECDTNALLSFLSENLPGDWQSFVKATETLSEVCICGESACLNKEPLSVRTRFKAFATPFLALVCDNTPAVKA